MLRFKNPLASMPMLGNPKECREHAKNCLRLADQAMTPVAKAKFEQLADIWMRLAYSLEASQALIDEMDRASPKLALRKSGSRRAG
jgi:hypothetical protein